MSGKAAETTGEHGPAITEGLSTVLSWLTVLPFRGATVFDRITGRRAMAVLPVPGLVLGAAAVLICSVAEVVGFGPLVTAMLCVVSWALLTRMMHIDGLADVGDALGSYAAPERAREIISDRYTGALGVTAVVLTVGVQVVALSDLITSYSGVNGLLLVAVVPALARMAAMVGCSRLFRPFSRTGFGALIIGTLPLRWIALWWISISGLVGGTGALILPSGDVLPEVVTGVAFAGFVAVIFALAVAGHLARRLGGLNGDCIGALIEMSTAVVTLALLTAVHCRI
ncbi:adenosylcobinamide-GDP ribazoletransferase [Corynebacterium sp. CCM 9204]|uniref:adenosylcobinamide-GDP ribazoletransferase n=1 Tax=Corynebacterium sp. CCM 9204 TaxID=3057616 RepID=UPI003524939D